MKLYLTALLFLGVQSAQAKVIELPYMNFTLPNAWTCTTEKTETSCKSNQGTENKQAVILINAKETTPAETMESFYQQLSKPKGVGSVKKVAYVQVGQTKWIQAEHSNSELPNYNTIYWITRVQNIAVLVSYSYLAKYSNELMPLAIALPKSFSLNMAEISRLSQVAQMAQNQTAESTPSTANEAQQTSIAADPSQPQASLSLQEKVSNLFKSHYTWIFISLCVIIVLIALFLR